MGEPYLLAIDQGTTSSRAILFDRAGQPRVVAQREFEQHFPDNGWVEHEPEDLWSSTLNVCREVLAQVDAADVLGIGITNQRETTLLWERASGRPLYRAIVWQDRRTAAWCAELRRQGLEALVSERTGLLLDPYFSGTKLAWMLDHVPGARARAERGELAFGTVDTFLLWRLTEGRVHATDASNASRTLLFNIHTQQWDADLLEYLRIPAALLPEVKDSAADFGTTSAKLLGRALPIAGIAGDQQAAAIGQACFAPGMTKSTYGTGCFMIVNTGETVLRSRNRLLSTVLYRLHGRTTYAVEGSLFVAGSAVKWLRDRLRLIHDAAETQALAAGLDSNKGVYLVPAFTGLGAPQWDPEARAVLCGLTLDSGPAEIVRAALEGIVYQTHDLLAALRADGGRPRALRVDGGMVGNDWLLQFMADITATPVERPLVTETTALGAACLAGLQCGLYTSFADIAQQWRCERRFEPALAEARRVEALEGWRLALARTCLKL